jgi:putative FmdB family regulatory protein
MRYDFHCGSCDATFEVARPIARAGDPAYCEECGTQARRIYGGWPIIWRPDGWNTMPGDPNYSDFSASIKQERPLCQQ